MTENESHLPLSGITALELGHAILGPSCGQILADMGADVIHVERAPEGDYTRNLPGMGSGFHSYFNRNKRSLVVDLKSEKGKDLLKKLIASADVMYDNFGPGAVDLLPLAMVNPSFPGWERDLRQAVEELGCVGCGIVPNYHGYTVYDPCANALLRTLGEMGLPALVFVRLWDERSHHWRMQVPPLAVEDLDRYGRRRPD